MPSIESSFMCTRKHDDICGVGVPALKSVGLFFCSEKRKMMRDETQTSVGSGLMSECVGMRVDAQGQTCYRNTTQRQTYYRKFHSARGYK
jgi:hypothetical protein